MHAVYIGVVESFTKYWFNSINSSEDYSMRKFINQIDKDLINANLPHDLSRQPRSWSLQGVYWKGNKIK